MAGTAADAIADIGLRIIKEHEARIAELEAELRATQAERQRAQEACEQMGKRIAKLEAALGNIVRFDRGDAAVARGNYNNLIVEACEALGGDWRS